MSNLNGYQQNELTGNPLTVGGSSPAKMTKVSPTVFLLTIGMMSKYEQEETAFKEFFNEKQQALLQAKGAVTMAERYDIVVNAASTGQFRKFFLKERLESLLDDDWFYLNKVHADKKLIERVNKHYHQCRGKINKMYKKVF